MHLCSMKGLMCDTRRDCSAPFAICPYRGKYSVGRSTPDSLASQKLLAGMADRGATSAVIECTSTGVQNGRCVVLQSPQRRRVCQQRFWRVARSVVGA